jgi:hypothetical protein
MTYYWHYHIKAHDESRACSTMNVPMPRLNDEVIQVEFVMNKVKLVQPLG